MGLRGVTTMWDYKKVRLPACFCSLSDSPGRRRHQGALRSRLCPSCSDIFLGEPLICQLQYDVDFSTQNNSF